MTYNVFIVREDRAVNVYTTDDRDNAYQTRKVWSSAGFTTWVKSVPELPESSKQRMRELLMRLIKLRGASFVSKVLAELGVYKLSHVTVSQYPTLYKLIAKELNDVPT